MAPTNRAQSAAARRPSHRPRVKLACRVPFGSPCWRARGYIPCPSVTNLCQAVTVPKAQLSCSESSIVQGKNDVATVRENATPAASPALALALQSQALAAYGPSPAVGAAIRDAPATSLVIDGSLMQRTSPSSPEDIPDHRSEATSLLPEQLRPHKTSWWWAADRHWNPPSSYTPKPCKPAEEQQSVARS